MKKFIAGVSALCILLNGTAFAGQFTNVPNLEASSFEIKGTAAPDSAVTIEVYAPGKTAADVLSATNPIDVVKYHNEIYAESDGSFTFTIELDSQSGVYPASIIIDGVEKLFDLEFVDVNANTGAIAGFNSAPDKVAFIVSGTNRQDLGFFNTLYDSVNQAQVITLMGAKMPLDVTKLQTAIDVFNEAVIVQALAEGDITGIKTYEDKVAFVNDDGVQEKWYGRTDKTGVDARISGKSYTTLAAFEAALKEAIVLEIVKAPNGYENVKSVMEDYSAEIGIASLTNKSSVYQALAGKNYQTLSELKDAYEEFSRTLQNQGGGSSGGGGGGSGIPFSGGTAQAPTPIIKNMFTDMDSAKWAEPAVLYLADKKIVSGKTATEFFPNDSVLREEFVTMICRAFNIEKIADVQEFTDVPKSAWHYDYVTAASQNEIISGLGEGYFGAGEEISRQDMAAILYRVLKVKKLELVKEKEEVIFDDNADIADYSKEALAYLQTCGVISGMEDNLLMPRAYANRAQAAQMIYKITSSLEGKI